MRNRHSLLMAALIAGLVPRGADQKVPPQTTLTEQDAQVTQRRTGSDLWRHLQQEQLKIDTHLENVREAIRTGRTRSDRQQLWRAMVQRSVALGKLEAVDA
jgi:hypothetical protein